MMVVELNACHWCFLCKMSVQTELLINLNYPLSIAQPFFTVINLIY